MEAFDQKSPEQKKEAGKNGMRSALKLLRIVLWEIEKGDKANLGKLDLDIESIKEKMDKKKLDLNEEPKESVESMKYWWWELEPNSVIILGDRLKKWVDFFDHNKNNINLLNNDEQKLINDLLTRAKMYLAYYEASKK